MRKTVLLLLFVLGCVVDSSAVDAPLIYGADDRAEVYELTDAVERAAAEATVAMIDSSLVTRTPRGYDIDPYDTFQSYYGLCEGEPYLDQPVPADCTGFLVAPDLIVTAGHCITNRSCRSATFVFGFEMLNATTPRLSVDDDDVYSCDGIVSRVNSGTNDYAVVRIDRPVVGRTPLAIRREGRIALGTEVFVSGHPAGLPMKVAGGASVMDNSARDYFDANLDVYAGNSGSPVLNRDGVVEGILVRGNEDYAYDRRRGCYTTAECADSGCPGWESSTRATNFAEFVPAGPVEPPEPDCARDEECDDGSACTTNRCVGGSCVSASVVCDDGNACTSDSCNPATGCDATAIRCPDDGDACTVELCDPVTGCGSTPVECGRGETCSAGECVVITCAARREYCESNDDCCSGRCHRRRNRCR